MLHLNLHDRLIEEIGGRSLGGMVELATGFSARRAAVLATTESGRAALFHASRERFRTQALDRGHSPEDAQALLEHLMGPRDGSKANPFSTLVAVGMGRRDGSSFAISRAVGNQLDELNARLLAARQADSIADARAAIDEAGFAESAWFADYDQDPEGGEEPKFWRPYCEADSWEALARPLGALATRTLFDWLAAWDVDFCLAYFPFMEPTSTFEWVGPTIADRAFEERQDARRCRKLYDPPSRRLLEACAILQHRLRFRRWPEGIPKLNDLAKWMDADPRYLAKVGTGERPMNFARFDALWATAAEGDPSLKAPAEAVSTPFPLFVATKLFEMLMIQREVEESGNRSTTIFTLGRETYGRFWLRRLADAKARASALGRSLGDRPWPPLLACGEAQAQALAEAAQAAKAEPQAA